MSMLSSHFPTNPIGITDHGLSLRPFGHRGARIRRAYLLQPSEKNHSDIVLYSVSKVHRVNLSLHLIRHLGYPLMLLLQKKFLFFLFIQLFHNRLDRSDNNTSCASFQFRNLRAAISVDFIQTKASPLGGCTRIQNLS